MTPRVIPSGNSSNPFLEYWLPMSLDHPATFIGLLLSSLSHVMMNHFVSGDFHLTQISMEQISSNLRICYRDAMNSINRELRNPLKSLNDATILAVLMCVENPLPYKADAEPFKSPFQAPLQGLQWLNVHSAREPNLLHQEGLCRLIELRGGLASITTPGLAAAAF